MPLPYLSPVLFGNIISLFTHNIFGIGDLCDRYFKVLFTKNSVIIYDSDNQPFLRGWRETSGPRMWRISLRPDVRTDLANFPPCHEYPKADAQEEESTLEAFSAYDLPFVEALVVYFHAAAGYPVRDMWLKVIKADNYDSCPGLTYQCNQVFSIGGRDHQRTHGTDLPRRSIYQA